MWPREKPTIQSLRRDLVADSIARKRKMDRLVEMVRKDERDRVLSTVYKTRERAAERTG